MKMQRRIGFWLMLIASTFCQAGDVEIIAAEFRNSGGDNWNASVTLRHDDTGWDHYADGWRVVDSKGNVLGNRVLWHPHENEQPFTRSLDGIKIPASLSKVYVEAHDKVHGWASKKLSADLSKAIDGRLRVEKN